MVPVLFERIQTYLSTDYFAQDLECWDNAQEDPAVFK